MDSMFLIWLLLGPLVGWAIANEKGRGVEGAIWGLFLGFVGWIIAACLKPAGEAPAATPRPPDTSLSARLRDLERLRGDGVLTGDEYAEARSRIIKGL